MKSISDFFGKIVKWSNSHKTIFALIITALFVLVHVPVLVNHEIWDDEGTVWALSKEINLGNIYEVNSVEPHPLLWEVILAPFSHAGLPYYTMNIISLFFVALAVFLLIRFAPMKFPAKLIFILSIGFFYYNPIIARDYSLVPLAICLICLTYKNRHEKPLLYGLSLAFLSQVHFLLYGLLVALIAGYILEETFRKEKPKKMLLSIACVLLPVILAVATTIPMVIGSFNNHAIMTGRSYDNESVTTGLYEHIIGNLFGVYVPVMEFVVTIFFILLLVELFSTKAKYGFYALAGIGFWVYVMQVIYPNYYVLAQKVAILLLILLGLVWMMKLDKEGKENKLGKLLDKSEILRILRVKQGSPAIALIYLVAVATVPHTIISAVKDINIPYSDTKEVATFVNEKVEENSLIIESDLPAVYAFNSATYVQIDKKMTYYNYPLDSYDDYYIKLKYNGEDKEKYTKDYVAITNEQLEEYITKASEKYDYIYFVGSTTNGCGGNRVYNDAVLSKYPEVSELNTADEYIEGFKTRLKVYKIK